MGYALFSLCITVVLAVLFVTGDIAAITVWFPHLGRHHHAPSALGYIAAYASLVGANAFAWGFLIGGPLAAALDG